MPTFDIYMYCPFCPGFNEFPVSIEAPTEELARDKIKGRTVTCPLAGHTFEVEPFFITHVYPAKIFPAPSYKLMPEETVKESKWLKGSIVEEPLPLGAYAKGSPKLATTIKNSVVSLIYDQPVESSAIQFVENYPKFTMKVHGKDVEYGPFGKGDIVALGRKKAEELVKAGFARWAYPHPEYKWRIKYRRDVFTKFYEEARRLARMGKISEAVSYLIAHSPGVTVRMIADVLDRNYWPIYREVAKLADPTKIEALRKEVKEQAKIEAWLPEDLNETEQILREEEAKSAKLPQIVFGPLWRGQVTLYPLKHKTETELLTELKRILTLEGYPTMSTEEEQLMREQLKKVSEQQQKQNILYWLSREEE